MCTPGYSGELCDVDVCESARCSAQGTCTARYLGGDLPPVRDVCVCDEPYTGPTCEANPCAGRTCSGRGICHSHGEMDSHCECQAGFSGADCESTCDNFCPGNGGVFPYMCSTTQDAPSFCNREGGCGYSADYFKLNNSWCCFAFCDPCDGITCDSEHNANDCVLNAYCVDGKCHPASLRPDGSVCHSQEYGTCKSGNCKANPRTGNGIGMIVFSVACRPHPVLVVLVLLVVFCIYTFYKLCSAV